MELTKLNTFNVYQSPRSSLIFVSVLFLLLLIDSGVNAQSQCIKDYDKNKDYFTEKITGYNYKISLMLSLCVRFCILIPPPFF